MDIDAEDVRFLKQELLFRMIVQNGVIVLNAVAFLIISTLQYRENASAAGLALAFTLFSAILAAIWCHHGARQAQIKRYLLKIQQRRCADEGWEGWLPRNAYHGPLGSRWFVSTKATFIGTGFAACLLGAIVDPSVSALPTALGLVVATGSMLLLLTNPSEGARGRGLTKGRIGHERCQILSRRRRQLRQRRFSRS